MVLLLADDKMGFQHCQRLGASTSVRKCPAFFSNHPLTLTIKKVEFINGILIILFLVFINILLLRLLNIH